MNNVLLLQALLLTVVSAEVRPGIYMIDAANSKPSVSLCVSKGIVIRPNSRLDICLTISSPIDATRSKSYNCPGLHYALSKDKSGKYAIDESSNSCMTRMRNHADTLGITLDTPIQFSYTLESTDSSEYDTTGTVSVHLKWSQLDEQLMEEKKMLEHYSATTKDSSGRRTTYYLLLVTAIVILVSL